MIRIRPYMSTDEESILTWCDSEDTCLKWTFGLLGAYPVTAEKFRKTGEYMQFTAIDKDDGFWQDKADEANMTVPQFKEHLKLQAERDAAVRTVDTIRAQENAREQYNVWFEESKAVKEQYPEFDLNTELKNPQFRSMLSANYSKEFMPSMRQIYELIHRDEIMEKQKASVQKNTIDNIKARGLRPDEAGSDSGGAVDYTFDASKMSSKERADIARRVKAGESYTFKR